MGTSSAQRTRRRRKVMALAAGGIAVGVATMATLASWTDSEWVFGGGAGGPGVGTSTFEVQQNRSTTPPAAGDAFEDFETNETAGQLTFAVDPGAMTPGDTVYAPVALRTTTASIAGTVTLQEAVASTNSTHVAIDPSGLLWDNLTYSVRVTSDIAVAANCNAAGYASAGTVVVPDTGLGDAISPAAQPLAAEAGNVQYYCFALTLPNNATTQTLQGRTVFPAWEFAAESD